VAGRGIGLAERDLGRRLLQDARPQQAADDLGAKRRAGHGAGHRGA